jgi:hypothetical protein
MKKTSEQTIGLKSCDSDNWNVRNTLATMIKDYENLKMTELRLYEIV